MTNNLKEQAKQLIENLPENSTWDDLIYQIYVRQAIESGLKDSEEGKILSVEEVKEKFGVK
jgi:predicted transcriptional regulator